MAWTVGAAFTEFENKLLPTKPQVDGLQPKINTATSYLTKGFPATSNMPFDLSRSKLMGSAAQGTLIKPLDDIDFLAVFDDSSNIWEDTYYTNSQAFIQRVRSAFVNCRIETIGVRGQAVRLFYKQGAHVDIAPVFWRVGGGYFLPAGDNTWLITDPDTQSQWFISNNQRLSNQLLPLIRLLKRWNSVHGKVLKSYHLSVMVANLFISLNTDRADAVRVFFVHASQYLDVQDPAGYSGTLSSYLTTNARQRLVLRFANAAQRAAQAQAAAARGDSREAIRLWSIEFGSDFPSYG